MSKKTDEFSLIFSQMLGRVFREIRESSGKSQEEIGRNADINRITIGKWENGKTLPDIYDLYRAVKEICPKQSIFWENVEKAFNPIFEDLDKAADRQKYQNYILGNRKKKP